MVEQTFSSQPTPQRPTKKQSSIYFARPVINEQPSEYAPASPLRDLKPISQKRVSKQREIAQLRARIDRIDQQIESISISPRHIQGLEQRLEKCQQDRLSARALSIIDDTELDETALTTEIDGLKKEIKALTKDAETASAALPVLKSKRKDNKEEIALRNKELADLDADFLKARQEIAIDKVRSELHSLHRSMAELLAIEDAVNFTYVPLGWSFVDKFSIVFQNSLFIPDWLKRAHAPASIPGFADAVASLRSEMQGVES